MSDPTPRYAYSRPGAGNGGDGLIVWDNETGERIVESGTDYDGISALLALYANAQARIARLERERDALRPEVRAFTDDMEHELRANEYKGEWKHCTPEYLLGELKYHLSKMETAIQQGHRARTREYGADCGNLLMMLLDVYGLLPRNASDPPKRHLMWRNSFETEAHGLRGMYFYEPITTAAPPSAKPYCCYMNHVIFYKQPYQVLPDHSFEKWDEVETQWDLLGQRWTDEDLGWASLAPFVEHKGQIYELGGGSVIWRDGKWFLQWLGWRRDDDDPRIHHMKQIKTSQKENE
ncbi:MAG: hypothetical protein M1546_13620 [Chloroflexi bacterium]|nr:hypothetical protein [Chloroflexota bacterium]